MRKYLYVILFCGLMLSCTRKENSLCTDVPIVLGDTLELEPCIKASSARNTAFWEGDTVKVYAYRNKAFDPFLSDVAFRYSEIIKSFNPVESVEDAVWWRGVEHDFYAYYPPAMTLLEDAQYGHPLIMVGMEPGRDVDTLNDFLYAYSENLYYEGDATVVEMNFYHVLSRIKINIQKNYADEEYVLSSVELVMGYQDGTFDMVDRVWTYANGHPVLAETLSSSLTVQKEKSDIGVDWLVLPGVSVVSLTCCINGKEMTVDFGGNVYTKTGTITTLLISVNNTGVDIAGVENATWSGTVTSPEISVE